MEGLYGAVFRRRHTRPAPQRNGCQGSSCSFKESFLSAARARRPFVPPRAEARGHPACRSVRLCTRPSAPCAQTDARSPESTSACPTLHTPESPVCTNGQEGRHYDVHVSDFAHAIRQRVHIRTRPVPICRASIRLRTRPSRSRAYADALAAAPGPGLRLEPRNRSLLLSYAPNSTHGDNASFAKRIPFFTCLESIVASFRGHGKSGATFRHVRPLQESIVASFRPMERRRAQTVLVPAELSGCLSTAPFGFDDSFGACFFTRTLNKNHVLAGWPARLGAISADDRRPPKRRRHRWCRAC